MSVIRLLFSTGNTAFSTLIRVATWSRWSHVALVDGDAVIEASALHGVRRVGLDVAIASTKEHELVDFPCSQRDLALIVAASQIGKPYDYSAILGLSLRRNWQEDDAWFCSELVAWSLEQAGCPWFRPDSVRRVTPQHLWMMAPMKVQN